MRSTSALLLMALALAATTTPARAGMTGNGSQPKSTNYVFCFGANPYTEYYSRVFPMASSTKYDVVNKGGAFTDYLTGIGDRTNGAQCYPAPTMAGAAAEKQQRESAAGYHHRKVVETDWAGG